ncbi:MAG: hypothetical protein HFH25_11890 [Lachnospiraceae bacterium]|nr:hypothetical protein [Lachnospiraceae bacterium]
MALFGKLFGANQENSVEGLLKSLQQAQERKNFVEIAKLYYQIGEIYLKQGNQEKAWLYIEKFDALAGSRDEIYEHIPEEMADQASEWLEQFEDSGMYVYELRSWVEEQAEELLGFERVKWNLLTMARFAKLFDRLSVFPGFELLADYKDVVEILAQALYHPMTEEEYQKVLEFVKEFYPFTDSEALADVSNRIPMANGLDFEAYDLISFEGLTNLYMVLEDLLQTSEQTLQNADVSTDFITNSLLAGYYVRTHSEPLKEIPSVQAEVARIRSDYEFVEEANQESFLKRFHEYEDMMLLS